METIQSTSEHKTILFVENENGTVQEIKNILKNTGIEKKSDVSFVFAENSHEALKKLATMKTDIVITEIILPIINGYNLVKTIKKNYKEIPVIIYTNLKSPQDLSKMAALNADNIFLKTLMKTEDLVDIVVKKGKLKGDLDQIVNELNSQIKALSGKEGQSQIKMVQCPHCNMILAPDSHFCNNCGQRIFRERKQLQLKTEKAQAIKK
jgi:CheY-like chemotaxis protein